jgi:hypothetical protein
MRPAANRAYEGGEAVAENLNSINLWVRSPVILQTGRPIILWTKIPIILQTGHPIILLTRSPVILKAGNCLFNRYLYMKKNEVSIQRTTMRAYRCHNT